jgi:hypothetical protein
MNASRTFYLSFLSLLNTSIGHTVHGAYARIVNDYARTANVRAQQVSILRAQEPQESVMWAHNDLVNIVLQL